MKHLEQGLLRAYHDGALSEPERERVQAHLAACDRCAREAAAIQARGARVHAWLSSIDPRSERVPVSPQGARHRLESAVERKKENTMLRNVFARRYRPAWVAAALVVALAIAFSFAPVRALAGNLLALFRVQKIEFVAVDPTQMPDEEALQEAAHKFESVMKDQIDIKHDGELQEIDEAAARSLSAFRVRLPAALDSSTARITLQPGMHAAMQIDLPRVRALLAELGYDTVDLPDSLDGARIRVDFSPAVIAAYGECQSGEPGSPDAAQDCTFLIQMPSPDVSAPPELDVQQLGQSYLQLLGMSAEEAARFGARVDWTSTLVVPVPQAMSLEVRDVTVDGVPGTLLRPPRPGSGEQRYVLTWVKNGIVYALDGFGTEEEALDIAGSLQ